jgi:hypothetical protein
MAVNWSLSASGWKTFSLKDIRLQAAISLQMPSRHSPSLPVLTFPGLSVANPLFWQKTLL